MSVQVWKNINVVYRKDLGFVLRQVYRGNIRSVAVHQYADGYSGLMVVYLEDDRVVHCKWASLRLCAKWLARPSLHGVNVFWINHSTTCDQLKYYHFGK